MTDRHRQNIAKLRETNACPRQLGKDLQDFLDSSAWRGLVPPASPLAGAAFGITLWSSDVSVRPEDISAKVPPFLHCSSSRCIWLMKFVPFLRQITLRSFYFSSHLGSRKFPVCKIPGDIDLLLSHGGCFIPPCCLCSALRMHPEINAAVLTPCDRQLLRAAARDSRVLLPVFPACALCVALP